MGYFRYVYGTLFGSCVFICIINCCCIAFNNANKEAIGKATTSCFSCLWSCVLLGFWIWGIVVIANKIEAPWTSWDGKSIMCH